MRRGEICKLKKEDVSGRVAHVIDPKERWRGPMIVPLSPRALEIWATVPDGFGVSPATVDALSAQRAMTAERLRICISTTAGMRRRRAWPASCTFWT